MKIRVAFVAILNQSKSYHFSEHLRIAPVKRYTHFLSEIRTLLHKELIYVIPNKYHTFKNQPDYLLS